MPIRSVAAATAVLSALALAPTTALAHIGLASSTPTDGSTLDEAPDEVRLIFDGELAPDGSGFTVVDAQGSTAGTGTLDLDVADRNEVGGRVTITAGGTYTVNWTATSFDGHVEEGQLRFSVDLGTDGQTPDTAVGGQGDSLTVIGALLVLGALCLATRRVEARP
ncbi:MAG: copper resistance protein CopC [Candidatus Limnocylindria bacterium]